MAVRGFWLGVVLILLGDEYLDERLLSLAGFALVALTIIPAAASWLRSLRAFLAKVRDESEHSP